MTADLLLSRIAGTALLLFVTSFAGSHSGLYAQATTDDEAESSAEASEEGELAEEVDPLAVPEGATVEELFKHIQKAKSKSRGTRDSVIKAAKAAVGAAQAIRALDGVSEEDELKAISEQMGALAFLVRYDRDSRDTMAELLKSLKEDDRPKFRKIGMREAFKSKISEAASASEEEQLAMIAELNELLAEGDFDRGAYSLADALARAIASSDSVELAASLYEDMAERMSNSTDDSLKDRASKALGAARRIRLPGNVMEVMGTTAKGEPFDWASYRGKVVLVDFWASWCGPCRAEIPNMKRNLALYGDEGFAIVGVNLDRTQAACDKYVEDQELTWTNLVGQNPSEMSWDNPLASYYGIMAIPTAILVDQEGKVVSLKARGKELDRLLGEILGPPKVEEEDKVTEAEIAAYERLIEREANELKQKSDE